MDKATKEELIDEIMEFNEILETVGLKLDGMAKTMVLMTATQEILSDIRKRALHETFTGPIIQATPLPPDYCPYLEDLTYNVAQEEQDSIWQAKCSITGVNCSPVHGLGDYRDCLNYKAKKVQEYIATRPKPTKPPEPERI